MTATAVASRPGRQREWITLGQAAAILDVSVQTVRKLAGEGRLSTRKIRTWTSVDRGEVEAFDRASIRPATATAAR
jgi:hypothetical protein